MNVEKEGTSQLLLHVNQIKGNQCLIIIHNKILILTAWIMPGANLALSFRLFYRNIEKKCNK